MSRLAPIALASLLLAMSCCTRRPAPQGPAVVLENSAGQTWTVTVEIADNDMERAKGLMFRWSLAPDHGMIFIFDDVDVRTFWMKNTRIPLDMIFIGPDRRIVGIVARAEPYTETPRTVGLPSKWVLEVAGGEAARHGIKAGDPIEFVNFEAE